MHEPASSVIPSNRILVVDDEPLVSRTVSFIIREAELGSVRVCGDSREVMALMRESTADLVLLDLHMPWRSGQEVLAELSSEYPEVPVIILTNEDRIEVAVECMRKGAFDFMTKPIEKNRLVSAVRHGLTIRELKREVNVLSSRREERQLEHPEAFAGIVTRSKAMFTIFSYIETVAPGPKAILITGESGTGKELIAKAIHQISARRGNFVPINVSGLDDTVFSDSLFGHLRGSYTGADAIRKGLIEQAKDGTLFLDEIGDLETGPQIKLLRLLQEGEYYALGSDTPQKSHARIVAATNASLIQRQDEGVFRRDLYYRLVSHHIELPPLRERREDIEPLVNHFVADAARILGKAQPRVPDLVGSLLGGYLFPGNVRELQGMIFDAVSRTRGPVLATDGLLAYVASHQPGIDLGRAALAEKPEPSPGDPPVTPAAPFPVAEAAAADPPVADSPRRGPAGFSLGAELPRLKDVEDFLFSEALKRSAGNQSQAAALLGVSQPTLSRWVKSRRSGKNPGDQLD